MTKDELFLLLESERFKRGYFILFLCLSLLGIYIIVRPEPFLDLGYLGLFLFNLLGGPGTYLIPTLSLKMSLVPLAAVSALGMTLNDSMGWIVGKGSTAIIKKGVWTIRAEKIFNRFGVWGLFALSVAPLPYDAVGLVVGRLGAKYKVFFWPTLLGKFLRFVLIGLGARYLF